MFVRAVRAAATMPSQTRALAAAPTLAAFAAALADELAAVQSALIGVQEDFAALVRQGGNSCADVGLIALEAAVQACSRLESQSINSPVGTLVQKALTCGSKNISLHGLPFSEQSQSTKR